MIYLFHFFQLKDNESDIFRKLCVGLKQNSLNNQDCFKKAWHEHYGIIDISLQTRMNKLFHENENKL